MSDELKHYGKKGMKWGHHSTTEPIPKTPSAGKQRDLDIKAARKRVNEGKNLATRILNHDSFGKPLGGRAVVGFLNPGNSKEDLDLASKMTRGQKVALGLTVGGILVSNIAGRALR